MGDSIRFRTDRPEPNSIDQDQTLQNAASDKSLHCLTVFQQF